jgi:hypothetical protein
MKLGRQRGSSSKPFRFFFASICAGTICLAGLAGIREVQSQNATTAGRRGEKTSFTDAQIVEGFLKTTFGAEFQSGPNSDRIRKFESTIRIFVDNRGAPDRSEAVEHVVADIRRLIDNLDIAITTSRDQANVVVSLVRDRDLGKTIRAVYGADRAKRIQRSLEPQCLSSFRKDESFRIVHSEVILVVDAGDFIFYDCAYEEILQALGPINDTSTVPWTMFNDDVQMGFFDVYDQHLMNMLYDPRVKAWMTR